MKNKAFKLVIIFGIISLLGDLIYEGARGVSGPYLKILGARAFYVGLVVGLGEFLGYVIRLVSGYFVDKTKSYWPFVFVGYGFLAAVPLLAQANVWQIAAIFFIFERIGKAIRSPAKDTIISFASKRIGTGLGFGMHEFIDQIGAVIGPLLFAYFLSLSPTQSVGKYQHIFSYLWIPFLIMAGVVLLARSLVRNPEELEENPVETYDFRNKQKSLTGYVRGYLVFIFLTTFGFINFALIGYHIKETALLAEWQIPFLYAAAMAADGVAAIFVGKLYDRFKNLFGWQKASYKIFILTAVFSAFLPFMAFSRSVYLVFAGAMIFGLIMCVHETIVRAVLADVISKQKRGRAYGVFNVTYGSAMLVGGAFLGWLYDLSVAYSIFAAVLAQLAAVIILFLISDRSSSPL